jgi:hypothetical protein
LSNLKIWKIALLLLLTISSSVFAFFRLFPKEILDITNSNWILGNSPASLDLAQSTAGQNAFIGSPWNFPPGNLANLGSPIHNSLLFSDTTPWFAYFVKTWDSLFGLPTGALQFVGIQVLITIVLLWVSVGLYIYWETKSISVSVLSSCLIGTLPHFLIQWWAPSVMFQFLIVVATWLYRAFPIQSNNQRLIYWATLFFFTSLTHSYFVPMVGVIFLASVANSFRRKDQRRDIYMLAKVSAGSLMLGQFLAGGFSVGISGSATGVKDYGSWSADVFAFFNTRGLSSFFPGFASLPSMGGFGYAGASVIFLVGVSGLWRFLEYRQRKRLLATTNQQRKRKTKPPTKPVVNAWKNLIYGCAILLLVAIGPSMTILGKHYWITQNESILQVASIFRSSGRFLWPALIIFPLWAVIYLNSRRRLLTPVFLIAVLIVQAVEFAPALTGQKSAIVDVLQDKPQRFPAITEAFSDANEVIYFPGFPSPATAPWRNYLIDFVRRGGNVINFAYANRFNGSDMTASNEAVNLMINNGTIRSGTIFIVQSTSGVTLRQKSRFLGTIADWDYYYVK